MTGTLITRALRWLAGLYALALCEHPDDLIRCVHGDEINHRNGARRICTVCGRALPGPHPPQCTTGRPT